MTTSMDLVLASARVKFGHVIAIVQTGAEPHGDFFFLAIKGRAGHTADRPYMTITGKYDLEDGDYSNRVSFFSGHYDITGDQVQEHLGQLMIR